MIGSQDRSGQGLTRGSLLGTPVTTTPTPTGDGTMDFSIATGDDTGLLAILEDI